MEGEEEMAKKQSSRFKSICVFCGSSNGKKASYQDAAIDLGKEMHRFDVSQAVHDGGRHIIGVIPKLLMMQEVGLLNVDGYYNALLSFIDKAVEEGFILPAARYIIVSAPTAKELFINLEEYVPRHDK
ncbi:unnamed protein product [Thlaspi arvense]|uniref:cytokinin riboside 5'-monophosphate phosphoribohydrolase n=1 Tax=Thlaspi arvense TaxID=13288 RepID=A0AAU9SWL3_THLAR|nr:unnamed protein product [Thlaspi arvense]